jgi:hypothetical protein
MNTAPVSASTVRRLMRQNRVTVAAVAASANLPLARGPVRPEARGPVGLAPHHPGGARAPLVQPARLRPGAPFPRRRPRP